MPHVRLVLEGYKELEQFPRSRLQHAIRDRRFGKTGQVGGPLRITVALNWWHYMPRSIIDVLRTPEVIKPVEPDALIALGG